MSQMINAHFDGKVIVPDEPVSIAPGQALKISIELAPATPTFADLLQFAADLADAPTDLSQNHDQHLYGIPKP